ncbi:hypothetical protein AeRB84_017448 [Aphanomyces euteiches]|nr:hypothetical protein AeRB84_017448 [Aphanomyces euteiches]
MAIHVKKSIKSEVGGEDNAIRGVKSLGGFRGGAGVVGFLKDRVDSTVWREMREGSRLDFLKKNAILALFFHWAKLPREREMDDYVMRAAYVAGAMSIVLVTLALGWVTVWKLLLSRISFIRELLDMNPKKPAAPTPSTSRKPTSFDERLREYKENPHRRHTGSTLMAPSASHKP